MELSATSPAMRLVIPSGACRSGFAWNSPSGLTAHFSSCVGLLLHVPPIAHNVPGWHGNISPLSIAYACRPRLRIRLTLGGFTFPRKP